MSEYKLLKTGLYLVDVGAAVVMIMILIIALGGNINGLEWVLPLPFMMWIWTDIVRIRKGI